MNQVSIRKRFLKFIYYVLALFAQPISCAWPLWMILFDRLTLPRIGKDRLLSYLPFITLMVFTIFLNMWYYQVIYPSVFGGLKYFGDYSFGLSFLALGRYFIQFFIPFFYALDYYQGSLLNMIGIPLGVIVIYLFFKFHGAKKTLAVYSLFFLAIAPVVYRITNVFVHDTYLLLGSVALFWGVGHFITNEKHCYVKDGKNRKDGKVILILIFCVVIGVMRTRQEARYFLDNYLMFKKSYVHEPSCMNLNYVMRNAFINHDLEEGLDYYREMMGRQCLYSSQSMINENLLYHGWAIVFDDSLLLEKKKRLLREIARQDIYFEWLEYAAKLRLNDPEALLKAKNFLERYPNDICFPHKDPITQIFFDYCEKPDSDRILCDSILEVITSLLGKRCKTKVSGFPPVFN